MFCLQKLKEMAECMLELLNKKGVIIIGSIFNEYSKDLTFDNIYHEHYNYWSLTALVNFSNNSMQIFLELKK